MKIWQCNPPWDAVANELKLLADGAKRISPQARRRQDLWHLWRPWKDQALGVLAVSTYSQHQSFLATIKTDRKWFCVSSRWQQSSSKATVLLLLPASSPAWPAAVAEEEGGRAAAAAVLAFYPKQQQHGHKGNKYYASRILGNIFAMNWNADTSLQTYISNSLRKGFNSRVIGFNFTDIIVPSCSTTSSYSNDFAFLCIHYIYMFV